MQQHEDLDPEPRGWLEKAQDFNIPTFVVIGFAVPVSLSLRDTIGFWLAVALVTLVSILVVLLLGRILRPQQRKRIAADAERGLFECAQREKGSTLRGRWVLGYVKAEPGKFLFQQKTGTLGPLVGPVEVYRQPRVISEPVKASWGVFPGGKVVEVATDRGKVELAASDASFKLLIERTGEI